MPRPRKLKSVEWRAPDGQRLYPPASCFEPPSLFAPVLSPQWCDGGEIESIEQHEERVVEFLKRREQGFSRIEDAERKRTARANQSPQQTECKQKNDRERKQKSRRQLTPEQR